jgi:hypothetical protein
MLAIADYLKVILPAEGVCKQGAEEDIWTEEG